MNTTRVAEFDWRAYRPSADDFRERVFLVTGAAGGIGRMVTLALLRLGAAVVMLDHKLRHLEKVYDEAVQAQAGEPVMLPQDLSRMTAEDCATIAAGIETDFGRLHGLLHNAAATGNAAPLHQYNARDWTEVMTVNLQAPYLLTRELLPLLGRADSASVLFTSAACGRQPAAFWGAYAIAYAGLEAQMKIWAEEQENLSGIRFNSIDPGAVDTKMRRRSHPGESTRQRVQPEDIVPAYLYLLSRHTAALNGQALTIG